MTEIQQWASFGVNLQNLPRARAFLPPWETPLFFQRRRRLKFSASFIFASSLLLRVGVLYKSKEIIYRWCLFLKNLYLYIKNPQYTFKNPQHTRQIYIFICYILAERRKVFRWQDTNFLLLFFTSTLLDLGEFTKLSLGVNFSDFWRKNNRLARSHRKSNFNCISDEMNRHFEVFKSKCLTLSYEKVMWYGISIL